MQNQNYINGSPLLLSHLPLFARYILNNRLTEFATVQLQFSRQLKLPLLLLFEGLNEEALMALATKSTEEYLTYIANNQPQQQIDDAIKRWKENTLPGIKKDDIVAEDITLFTHIRKQTFLHFLPEYSTTITEVLQIIKELDLLMLRSETASANTYINLLKEKIDEHAHFIQLVNNTSPAAVYVFDLKAFKNIYASDKLAAVIGYSEKELNSLGQNAITSLIHPADIEIIQEHLKQIKDAADGEIRSYKYRIKSKENKYRWLRHYVSVFKRSEEGEVIQLIGVALDVDAEKKIAEQLKRSEEQLLEAQKIARLGSFSWDLEKHNSTMSPQAKIILETEDDDEAGFMNRVHPADKEKVEAELKKAFEETGLYECEYRYLGAAGEKIIWSKGVVNYEDGKPVCMNGTVMDVTERNQILKKLHKSEEQYKRAEAVTHIGNYEWDLNSDTLEWSDELYRIYGLDPAHDTINFATIEGFNHPADAGKIAQETGKAIETVTAFNFHYRIILKNGVQKILHARGDVLTDNEGNAWKVVGTAQDVTERQTLIEKLSYNQYLYKEAEELTNMGNFSWDMETNKTEWTDQLYRIYGLEPQSEQVTFERFLSFIHPDDLEECKTNLDRLMQQKHIDGTFRIITPGGKIKTLRSIAKLEHDEAGKPLRVVGTERDITEKQTLINRLKKSEELYKQAQALAHIGNWTSDLRRREFTWSDEMYRIYEIEAEEHLTIERWFDFIHPDDKETVLKYWDECIKNKQPYDHRHRIVLRSGKIKMLHRKGELVFDKNGDAIQLIGTTQDITKQNRIEEELKENQTFIRKITDATPSIIASYNVNTGKYVFISEGLQKLLGYDIEEGMKKGVEFFISIVHPDDLAMLEEKNAAVMEEANSDPEKNDLIIEFTYRMRHKNGIYRWFHTYGTIFDRNKNGLVEHVLNITLDITNQITAEQKIAEQELFIQQVADASPTILYIFDAERNSIDYVNKEIYFVLGYTTEEIQGLGENVVTQLYHPEEYNLLPERKESSKKFGHPNSMIQYECRVKSKEGDWKWLLVREVIFKTGTDDKPAQILGAALDITKRKEMERSLLQNAYQLEQSNASLEEFAYVASHDLKEPLRKISTFGDRMVATQSDLLTNEGKIYLSKIVDASQRMQLMINDLLSISMISGNTGFEMYSLQSVLEDAKQALEYKIEQKAAVIESASLPEANIIPSQFRQLFQNLLSNSLKFVPEDRQPLVKINAEFLKPEQVEEHQLAKAPQYLRLRFSDNGIGFEEEYAGKIFQIFQRLHGRSEYEGTGIGLAICKKIAEHHGGIIYAASKPGEGATFTIIIPV